MSVSSSAVILIPAILHKNYEGIDTLMISGLLTYDGYDLVQKGYDWMLKKNMMTENTVMIS